MMAFARSHHRTRLNPSHTTLCVDSMPRWALVDRDVPGHFQSLEHLLRYCARPVFARDRLSVVPGTGHSRRASYVVIMQDNQMSIFGRPNVQLEAHS